jgi:hypothetical protein
MLKEFTFFTATLLYRYCRSLSDLILRFYEMFYVQQTQGNLQHKANKIIKVNFVSVKQDQYDGLFALHLLRLIASTCYEHLFAHHHEVLYVQQWYNVNCCIYSTS